MKDEQKMVFAERKRDDRGKITNDGTFSINEGRNWKSTSWVNGSVPGRISVVRFEDSMTTTFPKLTSYNFNFPFIVNAVMEFLADLRLIFQLKGVMLSKFLVC